MALSAARTNKPARKGVQDAAAQNRTAWKSQAPFAPGAGARTGTPPTSNPSPAPAPGAPPASAFPPLAGADTAPRPADGAYANGSGNGAPADSFRTDTDISHGAAPPARPRELQAWQPDAAVLSVSHGHTTSLGGRAGDDVTFGAGASTGGSWDQFAANEAMFGVTTSFDEDVYTTRLDRSAADFKERERKAQQIANEIMGTAASNPHIAEERNQADDSGVNEEDKYGAVVRGANAYVPPGARKPAATGSSSGTPPPPNVAKTDVPKVKVETPAADKSQDKLVGTFRDFMTAEKQRLETKRQAIVKNEMNKRVADLVNFSKSFKLNKPIPEDLVTILAKDEAKQVAIREKAAADAASSGARAIGPSASASSTAAPSPAVAPALPTSQTTANLAGIAPQPLATSVSQRLPAAKAKPPAAAPPAAAAAAAAKPASTKKPVMVIPKIPPFNPNKVRAPAPAPIAAPTASGATSPGGTDPAFKLNANAISFRPPGAPAPTSPVKPQPGATSPKPADGSSAPNPFFGIRPVRKANPAHIKDDFNPFKFAKVMEPATVSAMWPYNGKRFIVAYPAPPVSAPVALPPVALPPPHVMPPGQPMPPTAQQYDENAPENTQPRAAYPMVAYYPQYYPGQYGAPPPQHVMAGAPPPAGYIHAGFIPHMPYPPQMHNGHPPPAMYPPPAMAGMPPPQQYLPPAPPPGAYPTPNGAPPGSMPPTPIPAHAYYHPSPQLAHAVPYPMMMAPPPGAPRPHPGYDGALQGPPAPVPMAGGAHP